MLSCFLLLNSVLFVSHFQMNPCNKTLPDNPWHDFNSYILFLQFYILLSPQIEK